jgi:hypothetical protein
MLLDLLKYQTTRFTFCQAHLPVRARLKPFSPCLCARKVAIMKTSKQLSREAIDEFKAAYQEEFGQTLSDEEVQDIAMRLLRSFGIVQAKKEAFNDSLE